jgi:hypothetical protein
VPLAEVLIEFLKRNPSITIRPVGECFLNGGDLFKRGFSGMLLPPLVQRFLWGPIDITVPQFLAQEAMKFS